MEGIADNLGSEEYTFERFDRGKLNDLATLYYSVYGCKPQINYLFKKYDTIYTGLQYIGYVAYDREGEPVAFYGVIPCFVKYNDQIVLAAQSADTMTHPGYRYKGLFEKLATITFDLCRASDIAFVFGFPNQNSYYGLLKLGWKMTETMEMFCLTVTTFPLESFCSKIKWFKSIYRHYVDSILQKYFFSREGLPNSSISDNYGGIYRDKEYLRYKTYSPSRVIRIGKAMVWIKIKNGLVIGDVDMANWGEKEFDLMMGQIKRIARWLGTSQILFQTSPGTTLHTLFAKRFPNTATFPILFLDFGTNIPLSRLKFTFADIDVF
ncbi:MAG: GNAT family N-acetyltransferase [Bacteroidetes bacterium]|nr:MAG: GNAT family N-acetyltransferase [Bacteroidota bacterium]